MAEGKYASVVGIVQEFPDKPVLTEQDINGQTVRKFTIRSATSGQLVTVTVWPETDLIEPLICKGTLVAIDGLATKNGDYNNLSATTIAAVPPFARNEREVVNKKAPATDGAPF